MSDVELFRFFVQEVLKKGAGVAIASYGRREVIAEYMRHIFLESEEVPFTAANIVTPEALGFPDGTSVPSGKSQMLEILCKRATPAVNDRSAVFFFDDDPDNIRDCQVAGFKYAYHTPQGFNRTTIQQLEAQHTSRANTSCGLG